MTLQEEIDELRAALIDCAALLDHYQSGRRLNWDGSTTRQARTALNAAREIIQKTGEKK